jgi:NAD(P)-dependent dehydrogenase (short-subunit alcohol dehydrogenase family)
MAGMDKIAIVTGGASGIGIAIARRMACDVFGVNGGRNT